MPMNRDVRHRVLLSLAVISLFCITSTGLAQTLELGLFKTNYVLGEPIYPTVTVTNNTSGPILVPPRFAPEYADAWFRMKRGDENSRVIVPLVIRDSDEPLLSLAAGGTRAESVSLFFGQGGWLFTRPGHYQVTVTMDVRIGGSNAELESAPLHLTVTAAPANFTSLLSNDTTSKQAGKYLLWLGGDHLVDGIAQLESLAAFAPNSAFASHVNLAKGWNLSRPFTNYATSTTRAPDYVAALSALSLADDAQLPPRLRLQKALAENLCNRQLGRSAEAATALTTAYRLYRTHPELLILAPQLRRSGPDPAGLTVINPLEPD